MTQIDTRYNDANEIVKYNFFEHLQHSKDGKDPKTVMQYINAIHEFEIATGFKDFRKYNSEWAIIFKDYLNDKISKQTGQNISKNLYFHYTAFVRQFFEWLIANDKDYAKITASSIDFFHVTRNDKSKARATGYQESHDLPDILTTIRNMPASNEIEMRNKAILSLFLLTNPRISSLQQARIKSIKHFRDYDTWAFMQDPRLQNTKYSKTITAFFVGQCADIIDNVINWREHLISKGFFDKDYIFPKITPTFTKGGEVIMLLTKDYIKSDSQIRQIVKAAFVGNGLPYYKPHTFRHSIARKVRKGENPTDALIALSENFGHKNGMAEIVRTYGGDYQQKQAETIKNIRLE